MSLHLLIIDPQVDFCDPGGALFVPGADADMGRLAGMVRRLAPALDAVHVTLDSHHLRDIAHPLFWADAAGRHPAPFTIISPADVEAGRWAAADPAGRERAAAYVSALAAHGRYPLCVWPPHCLIGGSGHAVVPDLFAALLDWEGQSNSVDYVLKGMNPWTEHYSALQADVPDPGDPGTQVNAALIESLRRAGTVAVAGEAGSHCVANTLRDLADALGGGALPKVVLLADAVSPVTGFEALQDELLRDLAARGMRLSTTAEFAATPGA